LDLLKRADFIRFANIFGKDGESILSEMSAVSSEWPPATTSSLDNWKVTFTRSFLQRVYGNGNISHIRLSYLVDIIQQIVGRDKCKLNLFDYSCSVFARIVNNPESKLFAKDMKEDDIERGADQTWGGRRRYKKRSTRKRRLTQK
jgi:hypothetical protein